VNHWPICATASGNISLYLFPQNREIFNSTFLCQGLFGNIHCCADLFSGFFKRYSGKKSAPNIVEKLCYPSILRRLLQLVHASVLEEKRIFVAVPAGWAG
jgi:hypothetical protein